MNRSMIITALAVASCLIGCANDSVDKDAKRAQDRTAIRLSQAEQQRDEYKGQAEKLQSQLDDLRKSSDDSSQQVALLRKQVQDLQTTNTALNTEIEKLKVDLSHASAAGSAQAK